MSVEYEAKLIAGCDYGSIGVDANTLQELLSCEDISRFATYYDADDEYCNFGVEISPEQLSTAEGAANASKWIAEMNRILKTDKCKLIVTIDSW